MPGPRKPIVPVFKMIAVCTVALLGAQQPAAGPYTASQATAGRTIYQTSCSSCHGSDLTGRNDAPQLVGTAFASNWGDRTVNDLIGFMQAAAMPPGNPGGLGDAAYLSSCGHSFLDSNGGHAGNLPLTVTTHASIRSVAPGVAVVQVSGPGSRGGGAQGGPDGDGQGAALPRGLIVPGEVKNYVRVTGAMLLNPDPNDWLMIRHDYHATNYSPLTQIDTRNVKDLRLQWVWSMSDGQNQVSPVVHDGVMYINNPGNIVQALDARTGDLIWENRIGDSSAGGSQRGLAIYQDKVIITTGDAHIFALDARNGKNIWDTVIADRSKGPYSTTSGPLVIKGNVVQGLGGCTRYEDEKCPSAHTMRRPEDWYGSFIPSRKKVKSAATLGASFPTFSALEEKRGSRELRTRTLI